MQRLPQTKTIADEDDDYEVHSFFFSLGYVQTKRVNQRNVTFLVGWCVSDGKKCLLTSRPTATVRDAGRLSSFIVYATTALTALVLLAALHISITDYRIARQLSNHQTPGVRARLRSSAFLQSEFAVVTVHTGWGGYDWANCSLGGPKRDYCARHGCPLLDERHYAPEDALPLHWWMYPQAVRFRKLQYLEQLLRARLPFPKYFFWLDGDALFMDQNSSLHTQLARLRAVFGPNATDDPVFVLVESRNRYGLNNGVWLVQNSLLAHAAILDIYNRFVAPGSVVADQLSVAGYYRKHTDFVTRSTWLVPDENASLLQKPWGGPPEPPPFILHLYSKTMEQRRETLAAFGLLCTQPRL